MVEWIYRLTIGPVVDYFGWWTLPIWVIVSFPFAVILGKAMKWGYDDGDEGS